MRFTKRCDECPALVLWAREEIRRQKNIAATKRYQDKKQSKAEREMLKKLLGEDAKDKPEKKPENPYPVEPPSRVRDADDEKFFKEYGRYPKRTCWKCRGKDPERKKCDVCKGEGMAE